MALIKTNLCPKLLAAFCLFIASLAMSNAEIDINNINVNDIQSHLPAELSNTNLTMDDAKVLFKNKCIEVAGKEKGEAAYQDIETAVVNLSECITDIFNYTVINEEISEASPRGELDVVFGKYCQRRPEALECIENLSVKLLPCLDQDERDHRDVIMRIVRSLLNFVCHKGGDQIALFIAEKGPECLESKKDGIQQCLNDTFSGYVPTEGIDNVKALPKFVMGPKQCDEMEDLEKCIVSRLETCEEITPANIVESMFRFIKNETTCNPGEGSIAGTTPTLATPLLVIGLIFYYITKWMQES